MMMMIRRSSLYSKRVVVLNIVVTIIIGIILTIITIINIIIQHHHHYDDTRPQKISYYTTVVNDDVSMMISRISLSLSSVSLCTNSNSYIFVSSYVVQVSSIQTISCHHHYHRIVATTIYPHTTSTTKPTATTTTIWMLLQNNHNDLLQQTEQQEAQQPTNSNSNNNNDSVVMVQKGFNILEILSNQSIIKQGIIVTIISELIKFLWQRMMMEIAPQSKFGEYIRPSYMVSNRNSNSSKSTSNTTTTTKLELSNIMITLSSSLVPTLQQQQQSQQPSLLQPSQERYHIYVGNPCPWCHRVVLTYYILHDIIQMIQNEIIQVQLQSISSNNTSIMKFPYDTIRIIELEDNPRKASRGGWIIKQQLQQQQLQQNNVHNFFDLRDVYNYYYTTATASSSSSSSSSSYTGRCTAPLLIDTYQHSIISNESKDIVLLLVEYYNTFYHTIMNHTTTTTDTTTLLSQQQYHHDNNDSVVSSFNTTIQTKWMDLYPIHLQNDITNMTEIIYYYINNGVYQCGFATTQYGYDIACQNVRYGLHLCNTILQYTTYLCSNTSFTIADIYLLPTIIRFDSVYSTLFKAGGTHISIQSHYPYIYRWLYHCYNHMNLTSQSIRNSINITDATISYYQQLFPLNPSGIIPYPITTYDLGLDT